jgi:hypothetical protein
MATHKAWGEPSGNGQGGKEGQRCQLHGVVVGNPCEDSLLMTCKENRKQTMYLRVVQHSNILTIHHSSLAARGWMEEQCEIRPVVRL